MEEKIVPFHYQVLENINELNDIEKNLLQTAQKATANAYAPYSNFHVAASALLNNGQIISGTNQENLSYPVGICAERSLLSAIASIYPKAEIITMAISYFNHSKDVNDQPATPCGMCRQAMNEWEQRQGITFKLILSGQTGKVFIIPSATSLLPLSFVSDFLK